MHCAPILRAPSPEGEKETARIVPGWSYTIRSPVESCTENSLCVDAIFAASWPPIPEVFFANPLRPTPPVSLPSRA